MLGLIFLLLLICSCKAGGDYFNATSTISTPEGDKFPIHTFEFYPTVGELRTKIVLCFIETFRDFFFSCGRLRSQDTKMFWVLDNRHHNTTLYSQSVMMSVVGHLDGIILIDNDPMQQFPIFSRNRDQLVLRIDSVSADELRKYDVHVHFDKIQAKYKDNPPQIHNYKELEDFFEEVYTLTDEEVRDYQLYFEYSGTADCRKTNNERNMHVFLFCLWLFLFLRWIIHNKTWFFPRYPFYANRVLFFYLLKLVQLFILLTLCHFCYFPHERMVYMEGRTVFDIAIWLVIILRYFTIGLLLSILYSLSKATAFSVSETCDENIFLIMIITPVSYFFSTLLIFVNVNMMFYVCLVFTLYSTSKICISACMRYGRYCHDPPNQILDHRIFMRGVYATVFGLTFIITFYQLMTLFQDTRIPPLNTIKTQYRETVNFEVLLVATACYVLRLFDKEQVLEHYNRNDRQEEIEMRDEEEQERQQDSFEGFVEIHQVLFPTPVCIINEVGNKKLVLAKRKMRKGFEQLEESKEESTEDDAEQISPIFSEYNTKDGFIPVKCIDMRAKEKKNEFDDSFYSEASLDACFGNNEQPIKSLDSRELPICVVNPEYFREKTENSLPTTTISNKDCLPAFSSISILTKLN